VLVSVPEELIIVNPTPAFNTIERIPGVPLEVCAVNLIILVDFILVLAITLVPPTKVAKPDKVLSYLFNKRTAYLESSYSQFNQSLVKVSFSLITTALD
jgi:hypothetical protein